MLASKKARIRLAFYNGRGIYTQTSIKVALLGFSYMASNLYDIFTQYCPIENIYDEFYQRTGNPTESVQNFISMLRQVDVNQFQQYRHMADNIFRNNGTTFTVYSHELGKEKIFPFDLIPRLISANDWRVIEKGLLQRVEALEKFIDDIYHQQKIIKAGILTKDIIETCAAYYPVLQGITPPGGVYINIAGIDLIREPDGTFCVLEDNLRTPSGVSYVLENRFTMKKIFPSLFRKNSIRMIKEYPLRFRDALLSLCDVDDPVLVVMTPGSYNSAYFEHSYLAKKMGCYLVEGNDLFVHQDHVYVKTTHGPRRVDVIYRRIDDNFLDPQLFNADSVIGVPGITRVYAKGNIVIANGLGNGIADDKALYPHVPKMIKFYLDEDPILKQVETYCASDNSEKSYILNNLENLVVKAVSGAGGYDMLFGPQSTAKQRKDYQEKIKQNPRAYIAQPVIELSTCPTWVNNQLVPKRVDFRPYIIGGKYRWVLPGGLTRVALEENSYIVNSSQGGGSKDTWVMESV